MPFLTSGHDLDRRALLIGTALAPLAAQAWAQAPDTPLHDASELVVALRTDTVFNGVTVSRNGRIFLPLQRQVPDQGPELGEWRDGALHPYPDAAWNGWRDGQPAERAFVGVNAIRVGPDGALWVVDKGSPAMGKPVVPGGPKLVRVDLETNAVSRIFPLDAAVAPTSFVDDVRFNGRHAYLTDAGKPGLLVLDLESGAVRRVLDGHPSTVASRPLTGEGRLMTDKDGKPIFIHADQLEVSGDGRWFYYQPCTGPLSRVPTRLLDDPSARSSDLAAAVEVWSQTNSTGGTAMDAAGNIYVSDADRLRVYRIGPDRSVRTLVADPRLVWVDAMWIDDDGFLWMPAAQMNRTAGMSGGTAALKPPFAVFKLQIGATPVRR